MANKREEEVREAVLAAVSEVNERHRYASIPGFMEVTGLAEAGFTSREVTRALGALGGKGILHVSYGDPTGTTGDHEVKIRRRPSSGV